MTTIAIVVSQFNGDITNALLESAYKRLQERGIVDENIHIVKVPGAVEIPITAKHLAKTAAYDVVICFGAVIYGETDHYQFVCQQVSDGCQRVALDTDVPVIFGVLTTQNKALAQARIHTGAECADTALHMVKTIADINAVATV